MTKHGMFGTPIYGCWSAMLYRCRNPGSQAYKNYGGRGVAVCPTWADFQTFYADMGPTYARGLSLDRKDNSLGYSKDNCRWATSTEQNRNRRDNRVVTFKGRTATLAEICEIHGMPPRNVCARLHRGWTLDRAITEPIRERSR